MLDSLKCIAYPHTKVECPMIPDGSKERTMGQQMRYRISNTIDFQATDFTLNAGLLSNLISRNPNRFYNRNAGIEIPTTTTALVGYKKSFTPPFQAWRMVSVALRARFTSQKDQVKGTFRATREVQSGPYYYSRETTTPDRILTTQYSFPASWEENEETNNPSEISDELVNIDRYYFQLLDHSTDGHQWIDKFQHDTNWINNTDGFEISNSPHGGGLTDTSFDCIHIQITPKESNPVIEWDLVVNFEYTYPVEDVLSYSMGLKQPNNYDAYKKLQRKLLVQNRKAGRKIY